MTDEVRQTSERMIELSGMDNHARAALMTVEDKRVHLIQGYEYALKEIAKISGTEWFDPCYCHSSIVSLQHIVEAVRKRYGK